MSYFKDQVEVVDHKGFEAETFPIDMCRGLVDPTELICMVCGEGVSADEFSTGKVIDCPDCGVHLEVAHGRLFHWESTANEGCCAEFYGK